jgi:hypothetical protein
MKGYMGTEYVRKKAERAELERKEAESWRNKEIDRRID